MEPANETTALWHTLSVEETFERLASGPRGLAEAEAVRRREQYGSNELQAARSLSPWKILFEQFKNILILILLIAATLSAFLGQAVESIAIIAIVLFAVLLGFIQEYRAERAIEVLRQMAAPTAVVIRDGEEIEIPARELVPGDVVLLHAGSKVPADARLHEAFNLKLDEASLTGESIPVEKNISPLSAHDLGVGDRKNMVYAGTATTYGRGRGVVVATGLHTEVGKIAQLLQTVETSRTPLQENLNKLGYTLASAALVVVAIIVALGLFRGQPFIEIFLFGIALAVAVVPEALPAVVTISLAIGVQRMVQRHALVRRLPAVETLGSVSLICSDKTGTFTKGEMTVRKIWMAGQLLEVSGEGYQPEGQFIVDGSAIEPTESLIRLLRGGALASDAHFISNGAGGRWQLKGDPTEGALLVAAAKAGLRKEDLEAQFPRVQEIPFTAETKRMTTLHGGPDGLIAYSKGAPEIILQSCRWQFTEKGEAALEASAKKAILETAQEMAGGALRILALATKPNATLETAEREMTFLGLVGMIDPPRPEAKAAVRKCEQAGIKVAMITGDHPLTAQAVAHELGFLKSERAFTGAELETMSDELLEREVENVQVYARVSPAHKLRVVTALQNKGHITAMTGDGVNDAPALKKADIGIAMGITGTDVAKEAASMILTDDNFASIVAAVEEGRGIFDNIKKYLMYLLSSNIGEIGLMAAASLLGFPMPLTAVQILYVNLATDGLPALALSVDPPASDLMRRSPRNPRTGIFTRPVVILMVVGGLWSTLVNLSLFAWALQSGRGVRGAMTLTFVSLVLIQFFKAYNFRSDRFSVFNRPFSNKWLNLAILWELILLALIVHLPFFHAPFTTVSLPLLDWSLLLLLAFSVVPVLELAKWMLRRGWFDAKDSP
ncbi:MAG: cation-translocating P-type ATPase [Acidobacteria bacterium]|nr:cation-translocating P-type ATPase [Acidobacteriota bacterium]